MWIFGSNKVKIWPLTSAVEVKFANFQKYHFFAFDKGQKATFCQFWSESGLSNYIYEAKMWVFGSNKVKIWPLTSDLQVNFVIFFKKIIFLLIINARKQLLAIFCPNRNHMAVYMEPKCEFLGEIRSSMTFDLSCWGQFCIFSKNTFFYF